MNIEGKVCGYNKKTLVVVIYTIVLALVAFYVGAKYEKSKLLSAGLKNKPAGGAMMKNQDPSKAKKPKANAVQTQAADGTSTTTNASSSDAPTDVPNADNGADNGLDQ